MNDKKYTYRKEYIAPKMTVVKVNGESIMVSSAKGYDQGFQKVNDGDVWQGGTE